MRLADTLIQELDMEAVTTRRVLERIPDAHLGWRPAEKSRTLGQLALHVAMSPGAVATMASSNPATLPSFNDMEVSPASRADVLAALDRSLAQARTVVGAMDDGALLETWRVSANGREIMAVPRIGFLRSIMLNHWYHHRGQLSVYLRLLDVPLPSIYGPSADENPFVPA
ncbi:MAG: DinB family protein [Vicinamibacterales bacterium]